MTYLHERHTAWQVKYASGKVFGTVLSMLLLNFSFKSWNANKGNINSCLLTWLKNVIIKVTIMDKSHSFGQVLGLNLGYHLSTIPCLLGFYTCMVWSCQSCPLLLFSSKWLLSSLTNWISTDMWSPFLYKVACNVIFIIIK